MCYKCYKFVMSFQKDDLVYVNKKGFEKYGNITTIYPPTAQSVELYIVEFDDGTQFGFSAEFLRKPTIPSTRTTPVLEMVSTQSQHYHVNFLDTKL